MNQQAIDWQKDVRELDTCKGFVSRIKDSNSSVLKKAKNTEIGQKTWMDASQRKIDRWSIST